MLPPEVSDIPPPDSLQESIQPFLTSRGIIPISPPIRSGDLQLCRTDPFRYLLTRRLGLVRALKYSEALTRGSWFHLCLESFFRTNTVSNDIDFRRLLGVRLDELRQLCKVLSLPPTSTQVVLDAEIRDAEMARAYFLASSRYSNHNFPGLRHSWSELLAPNKPFRWLASELIIRLRHPALRKVDSVIQIDALLYNESADTLWLLDAKTTGKPAYHRAQTCYLENQTFHYLETFSEALSQSTDIHRQFSLPTSVKLGGMIHLIVQKPTIEFGMNDRPWWLACTSKRSSRRATALYNPSTSTWTVTYLDLSSGAQVEPGTDGAPDGTQPTRDAAENAMREYCGIKTVEKEFTGEPSWDNYVRRCTDWYLGEGDYAEERDARRGTNPKTIPINLSHTSASILTDDRRRSEYVDDIRRAEAYSTAPLLLTEFPRSSDGILDRDGTVSDFAPFYGLPVRHWPSLCRREAIICQHRDKE